MNGISIIGYGSLGKKIFEALSVKEKVKVYNRTQTKLKKVNVNNKFKTIDELFEKSKIIIRTSIGSERPLHPQHQHVGDFTIPIRMMAKNLNVIKLKEPKDIFPAYKKAINRKDNISTILVEYGDYYNEK